MAGKQDKRTKPSGLIWTAAIKTALRSIPFVCVGTSASAQSSHQKTATFAALALLDLPFARSVLRAHELSLNEDMSNLLRFSDGLAEEVAGTIRCHSVLEVHSSSAFLHERVATDRTVNFEPLLLRA